jgi:hypothetical protein
MTTLCVSTSQIPEKILQIHREQITGKIKTSKAARILENPQTA